MENTFNKSEKKVKPAAIGAKIRYGARSSMVDAANSLDDDNTSENDVWTEKGVHPVFSAQ